MKNNLYNFYNLKYMIKKIIIFSIDKNYTLQDILKKISFLNLVISLALLRL